MIRFLMFFGVIIFCVNSYAQINAKKKSTIKFLNHNYFRINDTLYAGEFEVTNKDYKKFLQQLSVDEYEKCKVDSSQWIRTNEPVNYSVQKRYNSDGAFDYYPVVNISHYGAAKYCEWLGIKGKQKLRKYKMVFTLPNESEWISFANINSFKVNFISSSDGKDDEGKYIGNIKAMVGDSLYARIDGGYYTVRVDAYHPNNFGLYNVIGNVAEMTDVDGVQKGGSWDDYLKDCYVDKIQHYSTPDPRVGFRVVAIVLPQKSTR